MPVTPPNSMPNRRAAAIQLKARPEGPGHLDLDLGLDLDLPTNPLTHYPIIPLFPKEHSMKPTSHTLKGIILSAAAMGPRLTACLLSVILVSLVLGVLPPLILQRAIDSLTAGIATAKGLLLLGLLYFGLTALSGLADSAKESYITIFGQKVTHHIRTVMAGKLSRLPAAYYTTHEGGAVASLFVNDVDTIEDLFDSGIISMAADALKIISILITVFFLSRGLFLLLLIALPLLFLLTRAFQKRMLAAQVENRKAVAGTNEIIPETMHTIRTIRLTGSEDFMERRYGASIRRSFSAMEKTNFYDSIYSPIILTTSALLIALMCILSVSGTDFTALFGMTAGTAAALIAYVDKVFSPLQSMGMEIENIQSAMAGAHRIREFLGEKEMETTETSPRETGALPLPLSISHMSFAYDGDHPLFHDFSLTAKAGEKSPLPAAPAAARPPFSSSSAASMNPPAAASPSSAGPLPLSRRKTGGKHSALSASPTPWSRVPYGTRSPWATPG